MSDIEYNKFYELTKEVGTNLQNLLIKIYCNNKILYNQKQISDPSKKAFSKREIKSYINTDLRTISVNFLNENYINDLASAIISAIEEQSKSKEEIDNV